jgi:hypothetical protein
MRFVCFRVRAHRIALAVVATCSGCDTTAPERTLDGLWGARLDYVTPTDTLTLALTRDGSDVVGFGILRRSDDPSRYYDVLDVRGSTAGRAVELTVFPVDRWVPLHLLGTVEGDALSGTEDFTAEERPITLRRFQPQPADAVGTWVLASRSGPPPEDTRLVRDTIIALDDGRAWRSRAEDGGGYRTRAMWSRRGDWLVLDQFRIPHTDVPLFDSLRVEPDALLRMTPAFDGSTVVETFVRVSGDLH